MEITGAMEIMRTMGVMGTMGTTEVMGIMGTTEVMGIMGTMGVMGKRQRGSASEGRCICRKIAIFAKLSGKAV